MVLEVDLLRMYSHVLFNFIKMKISLKKYWRAIELKGMIEEKKIQMIDVTMVHKNLKEVIFIFVGQLFSMTIIEESNIKTKNKEIKALLEELNQSIYHQSGGWIIKIPLFQEQRQLTSDLIKAFSFMKKKLRS